MLRVTDPQATVWDALLPEEAKRLPGELAQISEFLDDEAFIAPYREHFSKTVGRPSIPIETVLRMLYLKHRYGLGYESLCKEVGDSLTWRRFCRIPLDRPVPHPTTLIKIVRRCGPETIEALGDALLRKLVATKRLRARKLRVDTTAMEADIDYPTDAGLLRKAVGKTTRLVKRIKAKGGASRTPFRDRRRSAGRRMLAIVRTFRRRSEDRLAEIDRLTADAARIARSSVRQARAVARNLRRALRHRPGDGILRRLLADLDETLSLTDRLLEQTALRVKGQRTIPDRLISLADPDARTIRRGKARHPNEFGYKVLVAESSEGFIVSHRTKRGNPPDHDLILPAVEEVAALTGKVPDTVVADRGFGPAQVEQALLDRGVKRVGIPRGGRPGAARRALQHRRPFRRMARWRIGIEARISHLKHGFGIRRTRLRTIDGARTWVGLGVWAYNLNRMATTG